MRASPIDDSAEDRVAAIEFRDVSMRNGTFELRDINFRIPAGSYAVLLGRTGSGKSTLLELLCGLRRPQAGSILVNGTEVTSWDAAQRGIGFVPQDGALFTAMSIRRQLALPLEVRKVGRREIRQRVDAIAGKLDIAALLDRYPRPRRGEVGGLSGGERQRVALARALVFEPPVLCLDEPLSSVDEPTREQLYPVLRSTVTDFGATVLHVTHSSAEAERLGTMELRLEGGKLQCR